MVELQPLDPNIHLKVSGNGKGHIAVDDEIGEFISGTYLVFGLNIDQNDLPEVIKSFRVADRIKEK